MSVEEFSRLHPETAEERLGRITAECSDRLNAGEEVDIDALLLANPDLADEIRETLELLRSTVPAGVAHAPPGTIGDYTLRRPIGRGGMGVVYEAWENSMDRRVALKVLPAGLASDGKATTRFLREAQVAGKLHHENIVRVYATGVREGTPWYSMEFVDGETLAQLIARFRKADPETDTPFGKKDSLAYFAILADVFADVAEALQHAHSKGVTHRDIKPSNLILDAGRDGGGSAKPEGSGGPSRRLRILDFGLARLEGQQSVTLSGDLVGTPLYMSPEQARRRRIEIDHRTDIYSLGATMYEAICGRPPFQGKDYADTLSQIIEREAEDPRRVNPRVPRDLETIVLKCLRKDARDRYGTAEALAQDLRRFGRGDPVEARPFGRLERTVRRLHRNWRWIAGATALGLVLCASVVLAILLARRHAADTDSRYEALVNEAIVRLELGLIPAPGEQLEGEIVALGLMFQGDLWSRPRAWRELFETAVEDLEQAVELRPARPEAYVQLSRGYRVLGRAKAARDALGQGLVASPEFVPALLLDAFDLERSGHTQEASNRRHRAESLGSKHARGWEPLWIDSH